MRLYVTPAGQWAGTQADAKKLGQFAEVDVPTDKPGLLAWLNEQRVGDTGQRGCCPYMGTRQCECGQEPDDIADLLGEPEPEPVAAPRPVDMTASAILSRMDNPDIRVDDVVEAIGKSKMHALKRFAGAVAMRFQELAS